jgi:hypothetical protein
LREIAVRSAETGSVSKLFSGKLTRKTNGRAVLRDRSLDFSTQWWIPDLFSPCFDVLVQPIRVVPATYGNGSYLEVLEEDVSTPSSGTGQKWIFKFVGAKPVCRKKIYTYTYNDGQHVIVLRMSLARWWAAASDPEEVCYGDLSAAWAASRDWTKFVPLECDAPDESGQCACSFETAPGAYDLMWNTPRVDDLPS